VLVEVELVVALVEVVPPEVVADVVLVFEELL